MSLGDRIREKRKAKGMSGQQLGDVFGISRSSVSDWERGATRPDADKFVRLAQALDTTVEYLLENSDGKPVVITQSPPSIKHTITDRNVAGTDQPAGKLPVISWAQAGEWGEKLNAKDLGDSVEWVTSPYPGEFVLRVVGDSMYNPGGDLSFRDGDLISVSTQREVAHKKLVVVQRRGESVPTFKQYLVENDGSVLLHALNPSWPNKYLPYDADCRVVGVVTGQWREH
jgi:SOS-response transcriptional repressor LexA